jgi:hypothetical protein
MAEYCSLRLASALTALVFRLILAYRASKNDQ